MTPSARAQENPRITSPPKTAIAINTTNVVPDVLTVLDKVLLTAPFTLSLKSLFGYNLLYSLILSKITTVSLIEYPIIVKTAAINVWSTSNENGRIPLNIE